MITEIQPLRPEARSPFPEAGGECAARLRAMDWSEHPLGDPAGWPIALVTAVRITLSSRFPMMVHWGPDLITFYNDAYAVSLGRKHPGHLGGPARLWWSEIWDELTPIFDRVLAGETVHVEDARYTPDRDGAPGEAFFTHCHSPLWNDEGKVEGVFLVVTETTRHVLAESGRLIDEVRNRQIVDSASDFAIIATDLDGRVTRWNAGARNVLGWSEEEMLGQMAERIFTPDDLAIDRPAHEMRRALEVGRGDDERWHVRASGERFWAQGELTPLRMPSGEVAGFVKVLRDRTSQRAADEALHRLTVQLQQKVVKSTADRDRMWETSPDMMLVIDFQGVFRRVNPAWTTLLGYAPEELVGHHVGEFVLPEDRAETVETYEVAAPAGGFPAITNRYRHKDGSLRWISWVAAPADGVTYATGRDITAEKQREADLLAAEDALRQSQKMEAVGQLTGGVAHDFNNLLTIIRSSVDFLRRPDLPPSRRDRYVAAIAETVERAAKLTSQLLAFARRQPLKPEVFDVGARVREVSELVRPLVGARIVIDVEPCLQTCFTEADVSQFETALVNLAVNARDAMSGEGRLGFSVREVDEVPSIRGHVGATGRFLAVSVSDTGMGIEPAVIASIFEPFYTTKEVGKGTGLGLSQVFGFTKQSGGEVDVQSTLGGGATFTLYLPRVSPDRATSRIQPASVEPGQPQPAIHVLVVEDNEAVGRFAEEMLNDLGYRTHLVGNAGEALAAIMREDVGYDAVFSDVIMPGMNGVAMATEVRRRRPDLPVVLTSGYSNVLAQEGAHGFELLRKPYSIDELSRVLRRVVTPASVDETGSA